MGWKKIFYEIGPKKQAGIAILISNKIDFKPQLIKRNRRTLYTYQRKKPPRSFSILNIYDPSSGASIFVKETVIELKSHIDSHK